MQRKADKLESTRANPAEEQDIKSLSLKAFEGSQDNQAGSEASAFEALAEKLTLSFDCAAANVAKTDSPPSPAARIASTTVVPGSTR